MAYIEFAKRIVDRVAVVWVAEEKALELQASKRLPFFCEMESSASLCIVRLCEFVNQQVHRILLIMIKPEFMRNFNCADQR